MIGFRVSVCRSLILSNALDYKMPVIIIDSTPISEKDFIGGKLEKYFNNLRKNHAIFVKNPEEALNYLLEVSK